MTKNPFCRNPGRKTAIPARFLYFVLCPHGIFPNTSFPEGNPGTCGMPKAARTTPQRIPFFQNPSRDLAACPDRPGALPRIPRRSRSDGTPRKACILHYLQIKRSASRYRCPEPFVPANEYKSPPALFPNNFHRPEAKHPAFRQRPGRPFSHPEESAAASHAYGSAAVMRARSPLSIRSAHESGTKEASPTDCTMQDWALPMPEKSSSLV